MDGVNIREHGAMLVFECSFRKPDWMSDLTDEELSGILESAKAVMVEAYSKKIHDAWRYWSYRKSNAAAGQMTIYDCNA